jgi:hypothetical protein
MAKTSRRLHLDHALLREPTGSEVRTMKNDYKLSRALRDTVGRYTCANCLGMIARLDVSDVAMFLAGLHDRESRIDVMIAPCSRCGQSTRVFRLSDDRRQGGLRAISGGPPVAC